MSAWQCTVLVVDRESEVAQTIEELVRPSGVKVKWVRTCNAALECLTEQLCDVVLTELELPDAPGLTLVSEVRRRWPEIEPVVTGVDAAVIRVVEAMRAGAGDFLLKPLDRAATHRVLEQSIQRAQRAAELPTPSALPDGRRQLIGNSPSLGKALECVRKAAAGTATVLVRGETGTGKELVARLVHEQSQRKAGHLVKVQCSALPDTLLESELFGHERGAFTGANSRKPGRVELAEGGTLFLDEIGDIALPMQGKLLRLLQDRQYERLGSSKTLNADVRFVAATFRDLESMVESGEFRRDLFYRLNVVTVWLPPLRTRRSDIPELAQHFARQFSTSSGSDVHRFEADALEALKAESWPGNVRQLENLVHRLVVLGDGPLITRQAVEAELAANANFETQPAASRLNTSQHESSVIVPLEVEVGKAECRALQRALKRSGGNRALAARLLGISRRTLYHKLAEHQIE